MNKFLFKNLFLIAFGFLLTESVQAKIPLWTFSAPNPASLTVVSGSTATVEYTVTNQSNKSKNLILKPIPGIHASSCILATRGSTCILKLVVNGRKIPAAGIHQCPVLCNQGNPNQCYQSNQANSLAIRLKQQYTITSSAGSNGSVSPNGSQTVNSGASLTFTATPDSGYGVNQWTVDGSLAQTGGATYQLTNITVNHTVNVTFDTVTLTPSVSTLGLSVNCPANSTSPDCSHKNAALTGTPRQITITNMGSVDATNVVVSHSGLPSDASVSPSSCGTIAANGGQCVITVTPGATASSNASSVLCTTGVQPEGSVSVTADGGLFTSVDTYVLSYGCIYQGGFLFAIDDNTINTGSIGGKVATTIDQAEPRINAGAQATSIIWSSNGNVANVSRDIIPDIGDILGTTSYADFSTWYSSSYLNSLPMIPQCSNLITTNCLKECVGSIEGACNTDNIISFYNYYITNFNTPNPPQLGSTPLPNYVAGLCRPTGGISGYSDWYLPAICEMDAVSPGAIVCPVGTQSIRENLDFLIGNPADLVPSTSCNQPDGPPVGTNCLAGNYWSSTQNTAFPVDQSWAVLFDSSNGVKGVDVKWARYGGRCIRVITTNG